MNNKVDMNRSKSSKGFTLIELMVTLSILGIMAAIAFPSMRSFVAKSKVTARADQTANLFRFAKGEAARLNVPVVVCGVKIRSDGRPNGVCDDKEITSGMFAYADNDKDGNYNAKTDTVLRTISLNGNDKLSRQVDVSVSSCTLLSSCSSSAPSHRFVFLPNGLFGVKTTSNSTSRATFLAETNIGTSFIRVNISDANKGSSSYSRLVVLTPHGNAGVCPASLNQKEAFKSNGLNEKVCTL